MYQPPIKSAVVSQPQFNAPSISSMVSQQNIRPNSQIGLNQSYLVPPVSASGIIQPRTPFSVNSTFPIRPQLSIALSSPNECHFGPPSTTWPSHGRSPVVGVVPPLQAPPLQIRPIQVTGQQAGSTQNQLLHTRPIQPPPLSAPHLPGPPFSGLHLPAPPLSVSNLPGPSVSALHRPAPHLSNSDQSFTTLVSQNPYLANDTGSISSLQRRYPSIVQQTYPGTIDQQSNINLASSSYLLPQPPVVNQPPDYLHSASDTSLANRFSNISLSASHGPVDLLQNRRILPPNTIEVPKPKFSTESWGSLNCSLDIFRCSLTKIPETNTLLKKSRLPLAILIQPFRDLSNLPVIQCGTIVRCRQCRTYINPFVRFYDERRWGCNICYRSNDLPDEFMYDPASKKYGDATRRPEIKSPTIEYVAPSEYMLRPPQPSVYIFVLDVSKNAIDSGYVKCLCDILLQELDHLPGDSRTQIAFITFDRTVHFYSMPEGCSKPTKLIVSDIDEIFLPSPSDLLVNLYESRALVEQLLGEIPDLFSRSNCLDSALGSALQAAYKLASPTGGRISLFQSILPNVGPGCLTNRGANVSTDSDDSALLGPATDFYKVLALECSGQQIAVDVFALGAQYLDLASVSGISKFSGGEIMHFPGYHITRNTLQVTIFENTLRRYLTRKIGYEAVMRIRCTRGLSLQKFHGNCFIRSTDLLALPNVNPDAGYGIEVSIDEDLRESRQVSFQAALLYTSSRGERRIRVHTMCLPTTGSVSDVLNYTDQQALVGTLAKFAADRAVNSSVSDAREGLIISCSDVIESFRTHSSGSKSSSFSLPQSLKLLPLYVLACTRSIGFRNSAKIDERYFCFSQFESLPLGQLILLVYPDLYRIDNLSNEGSIEEIHCDGTESPCSSDSGNEEKDSKPQEIVVLIPQPPRLQLTFENINATGMYLLDVGPIIYIYVCRGIDKKILENIFGVSRLSEVDETIRELNEYDNETSERLRNFMDWLNSFKSVPASLCVIREDGPCKYIFVERMIEDRLGKQSFSYFEFLQQLKKSIQH